MFYFSWQANTFYNYPSNSQPYIERSIKLTYRKSSSPWRKTIPWRDASLNFDSSESSFTNGSSLYIYSDLNKSIIDYYCIIITKLSIDTIYKTLIYIIILFYLLISIIDNGVDLEFYSLLSDSFKWFIHCFYPSIHSKFT